MMPMGPGPMTLQPPELAKSTFAGAKAKKATAPKGKAKAKKPSKAMAMKGKR